jgi:hypothetical protein
MCNSSLIQKCPEGPGKLDFNFTTGQFIEHIFNKRAGGLIKVTSVNCYFHERKSKSSCFSKDTRQKCRFKRTEKITETRRLSGKVSQKHVQTLLIDTFDRIVGVGFLYFISEAFEGCDDRGNVSAVEF